MNTIELLDKVRKALGWNSSTLEALLPTINNGSTDIKFRVRPIFNFTEVKPDTNLPVARLYGQKSTPEEVPVYGEIVGWELCYPSPSSTVNTPEKSILIAIERVNDLMWRYVLWQDWAERKTNIAPNTLLAHFQANNIADALELNGSHGTTVRELVGKHARTAFALLDVMARELELWATVALAPAEEPKGRNLASYYPPKLQRRLTLQLVVLLSDAMRRKTGAWKRALDNFLALAGFTMTSTEALNLLEQNPKLKEMLEDED